MKEHDALPSDIVSTLDYEFPLQIQNLIKLDNLLLNDNQLNSPNNIELIFNSSEKVQNFFKTYFG